MKIRVYAWIEFIIWLIIVSVSVLGFKYYHYQSQKQYKSYQIFMDDVDGLISGSPVKYLGVQIGYVKDVRVISSDIYVKFVITKKNLELPPGVIATVEGSGLGGSKALEIYPPDKSNVTDKIIVPKSPTRLGKVMSLFDDIFKELDSILTTVSNTSEQFSENNKKKRKSSPHITPEEATENLIKIDNTIYNIRENEKDFMKKFNNKEKTNDRIENKQIENN